jgi:hypothetical protein
MTTIVANPPSSPTPPPEHESSDLTRVLKSLGTTVLAL